MNILVDKGSGSGIFPDPDPGDLKRLGPTGSGSGSATLVVTMLKIMFGKFLNLISVYYKDKAC